MKHKKVPTNDPRKDKNNSNWGITTATNPVNRTIDVLTHINFNLS